eukprot:10698266-Lingulodinium_polyedra.AAC.1
MDLEADGEELFRAPSLLDQGRRSPQAGGLAAKSPCVGRLLLAPGSERQAGGAGARGAQQAPVVF